VASICKRIKEDGTASYKVLWRDPKSREQQGPTVATPVEAETLKRLLGANDLSLEIAQHAVSNANRTPSVAEVIQEHVDLLIRPSGGTTNTYQTSQFSGAGHKTLKPGTAVRLCVFCYGAVWCLIRICR
jgi:hypothetical protein